MITEINEWSNKENNKENKIQPKEEFPIREVMPINKIPAINKQKIDEYYNKWSSVDIVI